MALREVLRAIRRADIASLPIKEACRVLADLPAAKAYHVTPALLQRAVYNALPLEQAELLLGKAGIRGRVRLADLAYFAKHDAVLGQVIAAIIFLAEEQE